MSQLEARFCTLCGPGAGKKVKFHPNFSETDLNETIFSARRSPDKKHFQIVECNQCGILYSDPACDPSRLAHLYEKSLVTYDHQEEQIYQSYAPVLDRALRKLGNRGTFLEIGGGRGFMLRYGAEHGFKEQIEIEPSQDAEKKFTPPTPNARFIQGIFIPGVLPKSSVSLACFFQMLDHVPDPGSFVQEVYEVLEPGGVAVCVTHNTKAFSAKVLGEKSPIFDVEHTYLFNTRNLPKLFEKSGFNEVESFPIANRYALKYWMNLAPLAPGAKRALSASMEKIRMADFRINLRAGNFAVVARKPLAGN